MHFKHILFPFDYSAKCRRAAPFVKSLTEKTHAHLTLLNVIADPTASYPSSAAFIVPQSERDKLVESGTRLLRKYAEQTFRGEEVDTVCCIGDPAETIIRLAAESHVDLIMIPTRGCGRFRRLLLGSVTAKVLDDSKCPVWTDAHMEESDHPVHVSMQKILCAVDEKEESVSVIRKAADLAVMFSGELHLINVIPEMMVGREPAPVQWQQELKDWARHRISALRDEAGVKAEVCIDGGAISTTIGNAALEYKADLIVIGRGHRDAFLGRLRTNAYAIIRDSPCPVLSL